MALRKLVSFTSHGSLKGGKLVLDNPAYFRTILFGYEDTPKVRIIIEKDRGAKTKRQLGYLFAVVYPEIARHTGMSIEDIDLALKAKYLKTKLMWRGGNLEVINEKKYLTSDEMGEYLANVLLEAGEMGIEIPQPDKNWDLQETTSTDL